MLRQLLSTTNAGNTTSDYEHCSTYPLNSRNFENSTVILPSPSLQPSPSQLPPLSSSSSSVTAVAITSSSLSSSSATTVLQSLPLSPTSSLPQSSTETVSTATPQNQFRINDDKNLVIEILFFSCFF